MKIDATAVEAVLLDCLFKREEIIDGKPPTDAVLVEGIINKFGFRRLRLESHRATVFIWLMALPHGFRKSEGGGWSFLNACEDDEGVQWGEHRNMDQLFCLGLGLGLVSSILPREMWTALPGGMPYYAVEDSERAACAAAELLAAEQAEGTVA